jgi:hypothetical protein
VPLTETLREYGGDGADDLDLFFETPALAGFV